MSGDNGNNRNNQQQRRKGQQGQGQQGQGQGRRRGAKKAKAKQKPLDIWRPVPPLPDVAPIVPASDPTALVRSLGEAPLPAPGAPAEITIAAVVDRAAGLALALAAAGGLLAETTAGDDQD
jgi:hypothetical protein